MPVVAGFTSASAIIIASSQVKGLFGLSYNAEGFVDSWTMLFENIGSTRVWDLVLGICCMVSLLSLRVIMIQNGLVLVLIKWFWLTVNIKGKPGKVK